MAAYMILVRDRLTDPEAMAVYSGLAQAAGAGHTMKPLVYYGDVATLEGPEPDGVVVVEFPDRAAALAWYNSPAYQDALPHRLSASDCRVFIADGIA